MRVFLELTVDHYVANKKLPSIDLIKDTLNKKLQKVTEDLINNGVNKNDLKPIQKAVADPLNPFSVDTLNQYVHNRFMLPDPKRLILSWDSAQIFFETIWS